MKIETITDEQKISHMQRVLDEVFKPVFDGVNKPFPHQNVKRHKLHQAEIELKCQLDRSDKHFMWLVLLVNYSKDGNDILIDSIELSKTGTDIPLEEFNADEMERLIQEIRENWE